MAAKSNVPAGEFTTMGTSVAQSVRVAPTIKGRSVKKAGNAKGGALDAATAAHRPGIQERMGAQCRPTATLYAQNAAEANQTQRNVRLMPSRLGAKDSFYTKRQYGQVMQ